MKAAITSALAFSALLVLGVLSIGNGDALAQPTRPEAGRGAQAGAPRPKAQPLERAPTAPQPNERAPSEDEPYVQDEAPSAPGCVDQGRKLELIV